MSRSRTSFPERWPLEQLQEAQRLHDADANRSWKDIAQAVGRIGEGDALRRAVRRRVRASGEGPASSAAKDPPTVQERVEAERQRVYAQAATEELKRLTTRRRYIEEVRDAVRAAAIQMETPQLLPEAHEFGGYDEEIAFGLIGDVHAGMDTPGRINGGWHQTLEVTEAQYRHLAKSTLTIWDIQRRSVPWRRAHIIDLGDAVEGSNMRPSQHRIVDPLVAQQAAAYGRMQAEYVAKLLTVFEHVTLERVPGNHGRVSEKAGNAGMDVLGPENSWDWVAGEFVREILRHAIDEGRLTLINHENWYGVTEVMGHRVIFEHGSSMRGGGGWGGLPWYGIARMASAYLDLEGQYSLLAVGHWHRPWEVPNGYQGLVVGNGSFPPTTPFVVAAKHSATRPSQTLMSLHPKKGLTMKRLIYLDTPREVRELDRVG